MKLKILQHRKDLLAITERELDLQQAVQSAGTMEKENMDRERGPDPLPGPPVYGVCLFKPLHWGWYTGMCVSVFPAEDNC